MSRSDQQSADTYGWKNTGSKRPDFAIEPKKGQESVWDYPRPPQLVTDTRHVIVKVGEYLIADSQSCYRLLETASPPAFYIPPNDIDSQFLQQNSSSSFCEWKGTASYVDFVHQNKTIQNIGWCYKAIKPQYNDIQGYLSFYPSAADCFIDNEKVIPQTSQFYGGWVTHEIVGPFKGDDTSKSW